MRMFVALTACLCVGLSVAGESGASIKKYELNIPRQSLDSALKALAQQTGLQIARMGNAGSGTEMVGPLTGYLTTEEALETLLKAQSLRYEVVNDNTIAIVNQRSQRTNPRTEASSTLQRTSWAVAQNEGSSSAAAGSQADTNDASADDIQEIVVTATKRAERIQDVPISITAITADEIDRRGLFNAADYLRGVPGTNQIEGGPFGQAVVIRGIETSTTSQNFNSGTTTATYFGETPTTNSSGLAGNSNVDIKLIDIERVEVLRGPQGTAFGSSSLGGAVRVIPVAPKIGVLESKISAGYAATSGSGGNNYNFSAVGNLPLVDDKLAIRATAYKHQEDGYYENRASSDPAYRQAMAQFGVPSSLLSDADEVGTYDVVGGRIAALFQANDDLKFTLSYLTQKTETDGVAMSNSDIYEQTTVQIAPQQVRRGQTGGLYDSEIDLMNVVMEYGFSWADFVATHSRIESEAVNAWSWDYLGFTLNSSGDAESEHSESVTEVRLATRFEGAWNFLAGLYYEDLEDKPIDQFTQTFYELGVNALTPPGAVSRLTGTIADRRQNKQKAAFGEVSWRILPDVTLTGGVRRYDYDRRRQYVGTGNFAFTWNNSVDASGTSYRANLSYKPTTDALVYAGWSQGFRLGRPQSPLPSGPPPFGCDGNGDGLIDGLAITLASTGDLQSDEVDNYEIGGKLAFLDRRLTIDAAVFRMEWAGMPATLTAPPAPISCGANFLANAGAAVSEGIEFQTSLRMSRTVRLDLGGSWIDARLTEDLSGIPGSSGNRLAGVPKVNGNLGIEYGFEIAGHQASVRADSIYVGSFYGNILESLNTKAGDYVKLDLSARVEIQGFNLDLYVRNLTNEDAFSFRRANSSTSPFYGHRLRPRTIGFQLGYNFR